MLTDRQRRLLQIIITEYVASAVPVGSQLIVDQYWPEVSSATVRNEMVALEELGLIAQPHTSAGRTPTIEGYRYYIDKILDADQAKTTSRDERLLRSVGQSGSNETDVKSIAKQLAELVNNAVVIGFNPAQRGSGPTDVYYTGISKLFRQPEFVQQAVMYSISEVFDHLDDSMGKLFQRVGPDVVILLGDKNPFGASSALVIGRYRTAEGEGVIGIIGPTRLAYERSISLIRLVQSIIDE